MRSGAKDFQRLLLQNNRFGHLGKVRSAFSSICRCRFVPFSVCVNELMGLTQSDSTNHLSFMRTTQPASEGNPGC